MAVRRKVPSTAVNGGETFSDSLVGRQVTEGTSQLSNTNFALDTEIQQRDPKKFRTSPFSDFLTLDDLKGETSTGENRTTKNSSRNKEIKFKNDKNNASKSLFGSLKERIYVSVKNIIENFPAGLLIDKTSYISSISGNTAINIAYDINTDTTTFSFDTNMFYNPFDLIIKKPLSNDEPEVDNPLRKFYSSYKKYVLELNGNIYDILVYTEPNSQNISTLKVSGNPFSGSATFNENILLRPNNGVTEEFFIGLDDLESTLLNRESSPIYNALFSVPRDTFDGSKTEVVTLEFNWPVSSKDNWNLQIVGLEYEKYIDDLINVADEIDDYKSNLFVRFLASPQLFEFDTDDQKIKSIFQLYGQSFDNVKKFIDNIIYMRNVSYDGVNNLPDLLLKNLSNTLGLETVDLINSNSLDELLYTKVSTNYEGVGSSMSAVDAEYEFYRRLLVNLAHLYKSKGTRKSIEFFLRFLGAPEPLIKIDQYIYKVTSFPKSNDLEGDIYEVIAGTKINTVVTGFTTSTYTYTTGTTTGSTVLNRAGYPVEENTFFPRAITGTTGDYFYQKGAGWYDLTLQHRSSLIVDEENSTLTGRTKNVVTRNKPYTYGEDYFDFYRTLPGLDTGYELKSEIDNDFTSLLDDNSPLILGRKNINIFISPAQGIDYDIWRKSRDLEISFGTLPPQTGITFAEFISKTVNTQIKNSHTIKYKKNHITLETIYDEYSKSTGFTPYNFVDVNEFVNKITPYWVQILEQFIPATTLWTGGNLIGNGIFAPPKYQYKYGCQPRTIEEDFYSQPDIEGNNRLEEIISSLEVSFENEVNELGEVLYDGYLKLYPNFIIDGVVYSGRSENPNIYAMFSGSTNVSTGNTSSSKSAKIYKPGFTDPYVIEPDYEYFSEIWKLVIQETVDYMFNSECDAFSGYTIDQPGKNNEYAHKIEYSGLSGSTGYLETMGYINQIDSSGKKLRKKIISPFFYKDKNGKQKIKFTTYKYGPNDCTVTKEFLYDVEAIWDNDTVDCTFTGGSAFYSPVTPTPTSSPIPTSTPTTTPTSTPTVAPTNAPTSIPTSTPTNTPLPATSTPTPTNTPLPATYTPTPTVTNTVTPTPTNTTTPTPIDCAFEIIVNPIAPTPTPTPTPTSDIPTYTPTPTNTSTPTPTPVDCAFEIIVNEILPATSTPTPTNTNTPTPTNTLEPEAATYTPTPTNTNTPTPTPSPTPVDCAFDIIVNEILPATNTPTPTNTNTPTPTITPNPATYTPTPTNTNTPTPTNTSTPTPTPVDCAFDIIVNPIAATPTPTATITPTPLPATYTPTPTNSNTPTFTPTPTPTNTNTPTPLPATNTPTPTNTNTPTPTPFPTISVYFFNSQPSGYLACNGGTQISVQLNAATFCDTTTFTSSYFTSLGTTTYWLSYDGNYLQIFHSGSANTATRSQTCQACNNTPPATFAPTPTPTNTNTPLPITYTPTPTNTNTPTPVPATNTPTPTNTNTPTPLPTYTVNYHGTTQPSGYLACNGGTSFVVSGNDTTFCSSTTYSANFFTSLGTGTFWISNGGNYVQVFHSSGSGDATRSTSCQSCDNTPPTPTPTPLPATATPVPADCTCYTLVNEEGTGATVFNELCGSGGVVTSTTLNAGQTKFVCITSGTIPYTFDPAITIFECGLPSTCTTNSDCFGCN